MEDFGWRHLTINRRGQNRASDAQEVASNIGIPPAVPGYDERRNIFLRIPGEATFNGPSGFPCPLRITAPISPDSGIGSSISGSSDGVPEEDEQVRAHPVFQRQMARRGRPRPSTSSDTDKRPRQE